MSEQLNTSLTSPSDWIRGPDGKLFPPQDRRELDVEEMKEAVDKLVVDDFTRKFHKRDLNYSDPSFGNGQIYCLHSFMPARGAMPDKDGFFGMIKCRGTFPTELAANDRAEELIRCSDSWHEIFTGFVGKPFPICNNTKKYVQEVNKVDIRQRMDKTMRENVREKRMEEERIKAEIVDRERELLEDTSRDEVDPLERYTELVTKSAHLTFTYLETKKKMDEMRASILRTRKELEDLDKESDTYKTAFMAKFMEARQKAGIKDDESTFIRYMDQALAIDELGF